MRLPESHGWLVGGLSNGESFCKYFPFSRSEITCKFPGVFESVGVACWKHLRCGALSGD
jgi:hypothetical protein